MHTRLGTLSVIGILASIGATGVASFMAGRASVGTRTGPSNAPADPAASAASAASDEPAPRVSAAEPVVQVPLPEMVAALQAPPEPVGHGLSTQAVAFELVTPDDARHRPDPWKRGLIFIGDPPAAAPDEVGPASCGGVTVDPTFEQLAGPSVAIEFDVDAMIEEAGGLVYPTRPLLRPDDSVMPYYSAAMRNTVPHDSAMMAESTMPFR